MSKNVFSDLGFSDDYASEMALRVAAAIQIGDIISEVAWTQEKASKVFGVPQATISKISRLQLEKLSLALLLRMLFKANLPFTIEFGGSVESTRVDVKKPSNAGANL